MIKQLAALKTKPVYLKGWQVQQFQSTAVERWWQRLSVVLQKGNGWLLQRRGRQVAEAMEGGRRVVEEGDLIERGLFHPH